MSSSCRRPRKHPIVLGEDELCFDQPTWLSNPGASSLNSTAAASAFLYSSSHGVRDVSPSTAESSGTPPQPRALSLLGEAVRRSTELKTELQRMRLGTGWPSPQQPDNSPPPAGADPHGELVVKLHQLVLQHQQRIDQLDVALQAEKRARMQLADEVRCLSLSTGTTAAEVGAARQYPLALDSPPVASPPATYARSGGYGGGHSKPQSEAELRSVWKVLTDEFPPVNETRSSRR